MRSPLPQVLWMGLTLALFGMGQLARAEENPVLIELFTSQGCSSCPPAEAWLNGEGMELFQQGKIIPLAFHVDYWDYLGWKDLYSSSANTERQKRYAALWNSQTLYTPQMVVQGTVGFVGSDADQAKEEIQKAKTHSFPLELKVHALPTGFQLDLKGTVPTGAEVWAVLFENAGRTLVENFVVREWSLVSPVSLNYCRLNFPVPAGKNTGNLGLVVFLQNPSGLNVISARCLFPLTKKER